MLFDIPKKDFIFSLLNPYKQPEQPAPYQFASYSNPEEQKTIENPQVKIDTVPFGEPKSKYMDSANRY